MERLLTLKDVCRKLGASRSSLFRLRADMDYRGRKLGAEFPQSISVPGIGTLRWRESDLDRWIRAQAEDNRGQDSTG